MTTTLTSSLDQGRHVTIPDDLPKDELEREMYAFGLETAKSFPVYQEKVMVRAWHHDAFRASDMTELTFTVPGPVTDEQLANLIREDWSRTAGR